MCKAAVKGSARSGPLKIYYMTYRWFRLLWVQSLDEAPPGLRSRSTDEWFWSPIHVLGLAALAGLVRAVAAMKSPTIRSATSGHPLRFGTSPPLG
jgi:hypothetical protein